MRGLRESDTTRPPHSREGASTPTHLGVGRLGDLLAAFQREVAAEAGEDEPVFIEEDDDAAIFPAIFADTALLGSFLNTY